MDMVFIIPFHVKRVGGSTMPEQFAGAYVNCYATTQDYRQAVEKCVAALEADGMTVAEIMEPIHSMDSSQWSRHIEDQWPDHVTYLPNQIEFEDSMKAGKVAYGPIGGYS
jgi:Asp-tRNA(Asn)/Glu-tRNA(Gln) amidotransferase A subunit family amidase